tara:strand:+ start:43 stop:1668 length:1626 start_codon:yes stop_codon:yes gene_type:complete
MLKFDNPLDTDVDRGDVPIGTAVGGNLLYGGPKYGDVTQEEYDELLKSGKLGRGQQTVELYGEHLLKHASKIYNEVGEYIPDLPGPNETVKKGFNIAKNVAGFAYDWTIKDGVETGMQLLGLPVEVAHWGSKKVDPTGRGIGRAPLGIAETVLTAGGPAALKGGKAVISKADDALRVLNKTDNLALATVGAVDDPHLIKGYLSTVEGYTPPTYYQATAAATKSRTILGKKYTDEIDRRFNRVEHMQTRTIETFKKKAGTQYDSLVKKLNKSYEHYEKHGNLKGMEGGTKWINEDTGEIFMIKNKGGANERVKLGIDSLESVAATKALREASAKITLDDVVKIAKETGIDEATAIKYFEEASKGKKDLMKLIHGLNKKAGKKLWSLGHGRAVKALRDQGSAHADMLSNIELEPLMNVVDEFGEIIVRGNSGRGAVDELPNALNTALNRSRNLREELLKFKDKDLGEFWPKMGPITDEASFLTESAKRDAFVEKVLEVNKKTKDIKVAIDEVLTASGMMQEGIRQPSTFLDASIYKNLKIDLD